MREILLLRYLAAAAYAAVVGSAIGYGQVDLQLYDFARPELSWHTIETEHFLVHYHGSQDGLSSERTAHVVARVAEEVYGPITSLYDHEPDSKVSIILKDFEDYSNGAAYFFDNKIEIWAPALDSPLRGVSNWLRNVITHEFTHIVQVQASVKTRRQWPIAYLQWLRYEDVRRPDVLYGYPSGILSYPIPALANPAWLAEGTAQFQRMGLDYDRWDSHRDMLMRTRLLRGQPLSLEQLGSFFNKNSLEREEVYNHGFAFTLYLADRFGEDVLRKITGHLSRGDVWTVERALEKATGVPGKRLFGEFLTELGGAYREAAEGPLSEPVEGEWMFEGGFLNLAPRLSPDGSHLAFLSNAGQDYSRLSLYVLDTRSGALSDFPIGGTGDLPGAQFCNHGGPLRRSVDGGVAWRPDGRALVYARQSDLGDGSRLSDLYELDLQSGKSTRLTTAARATQPAWHADGRRIVFVREGDGTRNLFLLDVPSKAVTPLTTFGDGSQVSDPVWDPSGKWVYFGYQIGFGRDIHRISADGLRHETVLEGPADMRSPAFTPDGTLYYASDETGIFNLYRVAALDGHGAVAPAASGVTTRRPVPAPERLTHMTGGAFYAAPGPDGDLYFSRYDVGGYGIARIESATLVALGPVGSYSSPAVLSKRRDSGEQFDWADLNAYDDRDLALASAAVDPCVEGEMASAGGCESKLSGEDERISARPYEGVFTSFTFLPVIRFDMYARARRLGELRDTGERFQGGPLWRNLKLGLYASSREVLEGLSIFGGAFIGPGSIEHASVGDAFAPANLTRLERDLFLQFEYKKGFSILPKRWSPQVTVEMYNIRRNVQRGLAIEEFPCTSCYPDTTFADVAYTLWEADLYLRSKISRTVLAETGVRYSPYRVRTEPFYSREYRQTIPASSSRYFIGSALLAGLYFDAQRPGRHTDAAFEGLTSSVHYELQPGRLLDRFDIEDGALRPRYTSYRNHRFTADARLGFRLARSASGAPHTVLLRLKASTILGAPVDDFFDDYVGGLTGARGYPFYALGGNETLWMHASYNLPLFPDINRQILFVYITKLYARLYADAASAWSGTGLRPSGLRKDVGAELRLGLGSFYLFPSAVFVSATYGLDRFDFVLDEGFLAPDGRDRVTYGKEMLFHFGVLFNFDLW